MTSIILKSVIILCTILLEVTDVALYIKQSLQCSLIKQFSTSIPMLLEQLAVEITIQGSKNIIISCMYRSPNGDFNNFNTIQ